MRIGIDFGTSYSQPAVYDRGQVKVLLEDGVVYAIPSVFYYDQFEKIKIGQEALDLGQGDGAEFLVREVKMDMKRTYQLDDKNFTGEQIAGHIIKEVSRMAGTVASELNIGSNIEGVVVSVPAAFTHEEKEMIKNAAKDIAGLNILGFIKEPVAAAISYFNTPLADNTRILVFDFGGGTCDVAIVESNSMMRSKYRVVDSDMRRIGGKDWDTAIGKYIFSELEKLTGEKLDPDDVELNVEIKNRAIQAKHKITSTTKEAKVKVSYKGRYHQVIITEDIIKKLTTNLLNETLNMAINLINRNKDNPPTKMICVGGSCKMPMVSEAINKTFAKLNPQIHDPANAIVKGAAIYASNFENGKFLSDIAAFSYGMRLEGRYVKNLILRGDTLPAEAHDTVVTTEGMKEGNLYIFESFSSEKQYDVSENHKPIISKTMMIPPGTEEGTDIDVKMTLTTSGLLTFVAKDPNGKEYKLETKVEN